MCGIVGFSGKRSGAAKLDRPISGRTAPVGSAFDRSRDSETTWKEPQCGLQGEGGAGGNPRRQDASPRATRPGSGGPATG